MKLKDRLTPTSHRQGQLQKFVDAVQELVNLQYDKEIFDVVKTGQNSWDEEIKYKPKFIEKIMNILRELRNWDITQIGDLYLTSGGRVVLDKGYGEYFTEGDKKIFTLDELTNGMKFEEFIKRINELRK